MDVAVRQKREHRSPPTAWVPRLLGVGLLERARSTTLALLGVTAAVGLGMVAVALNQSWPLIEGSPLPVSPEPPAVGAAAVVAPPRAKPVAPRSDRPSEPATADRNRPGTGAAEPDRAPAAVGPAPSGSAELVAGRPAPVEPQGDASPDTPAPDPAPVAETPSQPPPTEPPAPQPEPVPPPASPSPPTATSTDQPDESSVPPWSKGKGHAYGRSDYELDDDRDCDDHQDRDDRD